jgi:hypothetical protein
VLLYARQETSEACVKPVLFVLIGHRNLTQFSPGDSKRNLGGSPSPAISGNVAVAVERPLSSAGDFYYAGEFMMVPLHAAFERNDSAWEPLRISVRVLHEHDEGRPNAFMVNGFITAGKKRQRQRCANDYGLDDIS